MCLAVDMLRVLWRRRKIFSGEQIAIFVSARKNTIQSQTDIDQSGQDLSLARMGVCTWTPGVPGFASGAQRIALALTWVTAG